MHELKHDPAPLRMHGCGDLAPAGDLLLRVDARSRRVTLSRFRHLCSFGDDETTFCGQLAVLFRVKRIGHIIRLACTHSRQRCHDDPVVKLKRAGGERRK